MDALLRAFAFGKKFLLDSLLRVFVFGQGFLLSSLLRVFVFGKRLPAGFTPSERGLLVWTSSHARMIV